MFPPLSTQTLSSISRLRPEKIKGGGGGWDGMGRESPMFLF